MCFNGSRLTQFQVWICQVQFLNLSSNNKSFSRFWQHFVRNKYSKTSVVSMSSDVHQIQSLRKQSYPQKLELRSCTLDKLFDWQGICGMCRSTQVQYTIRVGQKLKKLIRKDKIQTAETFKAFTHFGETVSLEKPSLVFQNVHTSTLGYPETFWRHSYQNCSGSNIPNPFNTC